MQLPITQDRAKQLIENTKNNPLGLMKPTDHEYLSLARYNMRNQRDINIRGLVLAIAEGNIKDQRDNIAA